MENSQAIQSSLNNLLQPISDPEHDDQKENEESSELELQAAKNIIILSEQCQDRIRYNRDLLEFLQQSPEQAKEYLRLNYNSFYKRVLKKKEVSPLVLAGRLIKTNIFFYEEITKRLQAGEFDAAYLILKKANNALEVGSAKEDRNFEKEKHVFSKMLFALKPFKSLELKKLQKEGYISYYSGDNKKSFVFGIGLKKIEEMEIERINNRIEMVKKLILRLFKNANPAKAEGGDVVDLLIFNKVKEVVESQTKIMRVVENIHQNFFEKVEKLIQTASKSGSEEELVAAMLEAVTLLKVHLRILRTAIGPLVVKVDDLEGLCQECQEVEKLALKREGLYKKLLNLFASPSVKEKLAKIENFLKQQDSTEAEELLKKLKKIQNIAILEFAPRDMSTKEVLLGKIDFFKNEYEKLKKQITEFNTRFAAYQHQAEQSNSSAGVTVTDSSPAAVQTGRDWLLQLPPLEEGIVQPKTFTKVEQVRSEVDQERKFNQEKLLTHYRNLSKAECLARENRVKSVAFSSNIKSQFAALYSGKFSHEDLEKLVKTLQEKGELVRIEYPGNGSSHCTLIIRGSEETLEDFEGTIEFLEKAGSWKMQSKKAKNKKDDSLPRHLLQGIQKAFRRAGYTESALGLAPISSSISSSSSLSSTESSPAFLPGFALAQTGALPYAGVASLPLPGEEAVNAQVVSGVATNVSAVSNSNKKNKSKKKKK